MKSTICIAWLYFLLLPYHLKAQAITESKIKSANKTYKYYEMASATAVKGMLILLPAAGEKPKSIFTKTRLPELVSIDGYVTVIPEIPVQMFADEESITELNQLLKIKMAQYNITYKDIVIGGLSDGGAIALCYTEYLNSQATPLKLKATFAIDPPADMARVYSSAENELKYNCTLIVNEGRRNKVYLEKVLGGSPGSNPQAYYKFSAFSAGAADGGNAKYLKDVPVRLYSEPDLDYVRRTYCRELQFFDINAYDLEKLITFLKASGNGRADYIKTTGKGFHSWNIVDAVDCAKWISGL